MTAGLCIDSTVLKHQQELLTKVVPDNLMPESHSFLPEVEAEVPALPPMAHQWHDCMDEEDEGILQLTEVDNIQQSDTDVFRFIGLRYIGNSIYRTFFREPPPIPVLVHDTPEVPMF